MTAVQPWLPPPPQAPAPHIPPPPQPGQHNPYAGFHPYQLPFAQHAPYAPPPAAYAPPPAPQRRNRTLKWCFFVSLLATVACSALWIFGIGRVISEPFTILSVQPIGASSYVDIASTGTVTSVSVAQGLCTDVSRPGEAFRFDCPGYVDFDDPITVAYTSFDGRPDVATSTWTSGLASMGPMIIGTMVGGLFGLATLVLGIIWFSRRTPPASPQPVYAAPVYPRGYYR